MKAICLASYPVSEFEAGLEWVLSFKRTSCMPRIFLARTADPLHQPWKAQTALSLSSMKKWNWGAILQCCTQRNPYLYITENFLIRALIRSARCILLSTFVITVYFIGHFSAMIDSHAMMHLFSCIDNSLKITWWSIQIIVNRRSKFSSIWNRSHLRTR